MHVVTALSQRPNMLGIAQLCVACVAALPVLAALAVGGAAWQQFPKYPRVQQTVWPIFERGNESCRVVDGVKWRLLAHHTVDDPGEGMQKWLIMHGWQAVETDRWGIRHEKALSLRVGPGDVHVDNIIQLTKSDGHTSEAMSYYRVSICVLGGVGNGG